ncbi:hypothetical protein MU859_01935 [Lactobacillus kefiranofaciens subsp. kefirgranum]|uniref:hypothetical protein n=1 Tax=Lactobacillus kefiranofaciens TaxID=267818 RepID=UPI00202E57BC|nr:hypothetical protein [Lactobacillus kefiranofaciens]URW71706.1 hypothetical protein MU859_01935 [Lactobacillus kefiranofaciens subsp. kefirgranum]URW73654.1 hypothetical protein MU860_01935 [Lactobacillus kefiranofaciens subsp. kefirgranum]
MTKKEDKNGGCLATTFLIIIIIVVLGGCSACMHGGSNSDSEPKTHKVVKKKKPTKKQIEEKKQKEKDIKNSQKDMDDALSEDSLLSKFAYKIIYKGDDMAEIKVTESFTNLSTQQKNYLAKKFNNLVTSNTDDANANADPYCLLTFTTSTEELIGNSKQLSHNEYKWKD